MGRRKKGSITAAEMGQRSGKARMKKLTPEQRQAIARQAAQARWAAVKATTKKTPPKGGG
jgi:hypothetical protein